MSKFNYWSTIYLVQLDRSENASGSARVWKVLYKYLQNATLQLAEPSWDFPPTPFLPLIELLALEPKLLALQTNCSPSQGKPPSALAS